MLKTLRNFGFALAAYWVVATPAPAYAAASCDVPLPIIRTVGEANVAAANGYTIRIYSGSYPDKLTMAKILRVDATNGLATIGRQNQ